jgi:hypothetical protein
LEKKDKPNCWEFKKCGRIPGGTLNDFAGVCPAFSEKRLNGIHSGHNAGRACWVVAGTMCSGKIQGTFASKFKGCGLCNFFKTIKQDEGRNLLKSSDLLEKLEDETILSQK